MAVDGCLVRVLRIVGMSGAGRDRAIRPLDIIERMFDDVRMAMDADHVFPKRTDNSPSQPTSEPGISLPELVDFLTDALVRARLAVDALTDSLRVRQMNQVEGRRLATTTVAPARFLAIPTEPGE
jgi:hypothetical protein